MKLQLILLLAVCLIAHTCDQAMGQNYSLELTTDPAVGSETEVLLTPFQPKEFYLVARVGQDSLEIGGWQGGIQIQSLTPTSSLVVGAIAIFPSGSAINLASDAQQDCIEFAVGMGNCVTVAPDSIYILAQVSLLALAEFSTAILNLSGQPVAGSTNPLAVVDCSGEGMSLAPEAPLIVLRNENEPLVPARIETEINVRTGALMAGGKTLLPPYTIRATQEQLTVNGQLVYDFGARLREIANPNPYPELDDANRALVQTFLKTEKWNEAVDAYAWVLEEAGWSIVLESNASGDYTRAEAVAPDGDHTGISFEQFRQYLSGESASASRASAHAPAITLANSALVPLDRGCFVVLGPNGMVIIPSDLGKRFLDGETAAVATVDSIRGRLGQ